MAESRFEMTNHAQQLDEITERYPSDSEGEFSDEEAFESIKRQGLPSEETLKNMSTQLFSKGDLSRLLDTTGVRSKRDKRFIVGFYRAEELIPETETSETSVKGGPRPGMHTRTTSSQSNLSMTSQEDLDNTTAQLDAYTRQRQESLGKCPRLKAVDDRLDKMRNDCEKSAGISEGLDRVLARVIKLKRSSGQK
ncbi:uncharacterized protein L199_001401 [Kwoniella botswanensis]|uniref:uncharacterized protein n=1 Tax=Kwoniella botswanensis TaxID=1268659 RepID=UPI00315D770D